MVPTYVKVAPLRAEDDYLLLFLGANLLSQARLFDSQVIDACLKFIRSLFLLQFPLLSVCVTELSRTQCRRASGCTLGLL